MMLGMDDQPFHLKNRHQRRRFIANFRRAKLESVPRDPEVATMIAGPCDQPGCPEPWAFSTWATIKGQREIVARRCLEHRMV
jgi:hypothetical protein